ncbi:hypothetical protein BO70DRAFT_343791 [Aspergillus heteromorphus CBS 117.55]|uniref:Uncharacterized protein n=1 Tax=Aspergillus heteromorphus CBS 117.55 TaxID=1448321 RepID=A0A317VBB7_9EURO|nr:uncharacterized protein BO70DRAFT_343791 [Aspergillus heteromorphus CBS 117.55]PWY70242.1 hypothetical protein BO70DRAFT_343791 [Aspergillus heteromorphus CBS 117.55]
MESYSSCKHSHGTNKQDIYQTINHLSKQARKKTRQSINHTHSVHERRNSTHPVHCILQEGRRSK